MKRLLRVARTEYANHVRSKAFVIGLLAFPVFIGGAILVQVLFQDQKDVSDKKIAVVDQTGRLFEDLELSAEARNRSVFKEADGERKQTDSQFLLEQVDGDDTEKLRANLSDRVRQGELFAYVIIEDGVLEPGGDARLAYHTLTPTYFDLPNWLRMAVGGLVRDLRFDSADLDRRLVERLSTPVRLDTLGLVQVTSTGEVTKAETVHGEASLAVGIAAMMLMFLLVMTSAPALLNNVLEEKLQRISEVLISSVSPFELFAGKILGSTFVSLTLSILYVGGAAFLVYHFGVERYVPTSLYAWLFLFQILALFIYGAIFSSLGAVCSDLRDTQTMMMPAMLLVMIPFFCYVPILQNPNSTFAITISLFPPATPMLMLLRLAIQPGPAAWEIAAALVLTSLFTVGCIWAAARIFRIGILSQGQAPSFKQLARWVVRAH
ncbi:MAG: ABC transporter permease [Planctomycetota bacterium]